MYQSFRGYNKPPEVDYTIADSHGKNPDISDSYWYWVRKAAPSDAGNLNVINVNQMPGEPSKFGESSQLVIRLSENEPGAVSGHTYDGMPILHKGSTLYIMRLGLQNIGRGAAILDGPESLIATVEDKTVDMALSHWIGMEDIDRGQVAFDTVTPDTQAVLIRSWLTFYQKIVGHILENPEVS